MVCFPHQFLTVNEETRGLDDRVGRISRVLVIFAPQTAGGEQGTQPDETYSSGTVACLLCT